MGLTASRIVDEARMKNNLEELNLNSVGIKELPRYLEDYRSLRQVSLANNGIKELPYTIDSFVALEAINIHNNKKIRRLPEFGPRSKLRVLIASENKIRTLPPTMVACSHLYSIDFSSNKFEEFPEVLCTISSLRVIHFAKNNIKDVPPTISLLKNLETLNLSNNKIHLLPQEIGQLSSLQELFLDGNEIRVLPPEFANLPLLENRMVVGLSRNPLKRRLEQRLRKGERVLWTYLRTDDYHLYYAAYLHKYDDQKAREEEKASRKREKDEKREERERSKWESRTRKESERDNRAVAHIAPPSVIASTAGVAAVGLGRETYGGREGVRKSTGISPEAAAMAIGIYPEIARTAPPVVLQQPEIKRGGLVGGMPPQPRYGTIAPIPLVTSAGGYFTPVGQPIDVQSTEIDQYAGRQRFQFEDTGEQNVTESRDRPYRDENTRPVRQEQRGEVPTTLPTGQQQYQTTYPKQPREEFETTAVSGGKTSDIYGVGKPQAQGVTPDVPKIVYSQGA